MGVVPSLDCTKITPRGVYTHCDSLQGGLTGVSTKEKIFQAIRPYRELVSTLKLTESGAFCYNRNQPVILILWQC
jgi:hypothetical protein